MKFLFLLAQPSLDRNGFRKMLDEGEFESCVRRLLAAADGMPRKEELAQEEAAAERAQERGWFTPDEDELVRSSYCRYLAARSGLLEILQITRSMVGNSDASWRSQMAYFALAFAAAAMLVRGSSYVIELAKKRPVIWKKLDEPEARYGLVAKTFTELHKSVTSPVDLLHFRKAVQFYLQHKSEIHQLEKGELFAAVLKILKNEEQSFHVSHRDIWIRRLFYRWYSFLRSNRSGYRKVMFHLFRVSGSTIAELRQPGVKERGMPKRISSSQRTELLELAQPGDVFITRHDDAMSNLFLPGYWPHAALFLGGKKSEQTESGSCRYQHDFLEAKKDGVLFRAASETLHVDSCLILRPPLEVQQREIALQRACSHEGKMYDFLFDFRTSDRLACTEVIYRTYHGIAGMHFSLVIKSGRACLPAEDLIDQCLAQGFSLVAVCNYRKNQICVGEEAFADLQRSRKHLSAAGDSPIASDARE